MTITTTPAPVAGATVGDDGTSRIQFSGSNLRDTNRRLPAAVALARATGGLYAENLTGMTIDQALAAAGLDFTVIKAGPLSVPVDDVPVTGLTKMRATVATWPGGDTEPRLLGVVGKDYPVAQPAQAGEFGQVLLDESGATVVAVCAYGDPTGSRMLLALKLPTGLKIGGEDPYDVYLYLGNSFNRETSLWGCVAPIRIDCTNQTAATFGRRANRFAIPHRGDMDAKVGDARETLKITGTFTAEFAAAAERMLTAPMVGTEVDEFLTELFPTPQTVKSARGVESWGLRRYQVGQIIRQGEHNTVGRGTRYAAYQGVAEWTDHIMNASSPLSRATRLVDGGQTEQIKIRAAHLLLSGL